MLGPARTGREREAASRQPDTAATVYEAVGGKNFNVRDPDADTASGIRSESSCTEHEGVQGAESGTGDGDTLAAPRHARVGSDDVAETAGTEVVIGTDDRVRVGATTAYPWRAICSPLITAANGRRIIGTGSFIGPRTVTTAGRRVYLHDEGGWARSTEVIPGRNDASRPFGSASSGNLRGVAGWTQSRNRDADYSAIIPPANARLGDRIGWFGYAVRDDAYLRAAALHLSGYPGDKAGSAQQGFMAQRRKSVSGRVITYDIDTMGGQSGSPVRAPRRRRVAQRQSGTWPPLTGLPSRSNCSRVR